jgi:hypothetical protein
VEQAARTSAEYKIAGEQVRVLQKEQKEMSALSTQIVDLIVAGKTVEADRLAVTSPAPERKLS